MAEDTACRECGGPSGVSGLMLVCARCGHEWPRDDVRKALLGLAGVSTAADDQAQAMTDAELGACLLNGGWTTIEVHEAGRRLQRRATGAPA